MDPRYFHKGYSCYFLVSQLQYLSLSMCEDVHGFVGVSKQDSINDEVLEPAIFLNDSHTPENFPYLYTKMHIIIFKVSANHVMYKMRYISSVLFVGH